jgi:seryl-tRNA synthetase
MFDIKIIRENPQLVGDNAKKRGYDSKIVDQALKLDESWRSFKKQADDLRRERNKVSEEINQLKKAGKDASKALKRAKEIPEQLKEVEVDVVETEKKRDELLYKIPNIIHADVPVGKDASGNVTRRTWGKAEKKAFAMDPVPLFLEKHGLADFDRSAKVAGNGFYYLKGDLALLNLALIQYAVQHLMKKGFTYIEPPLMLHHKVVDGMVDMQFFNDMIYKIEGEDLYLNATAEFALGGMHMDEVIPAEKLPLRYAGYCMSFRKEIGAHGINEKGTWRTHQFNKIEQFVYCAPEDSWKMHEELLKNTEEIFQGLEIPYRVLEMCTGDLGMMKARQYDIEGWFPLQGCYAELASCSNLTDHQARRLNIRYSTNDGTAFAHTLNNTAIATSRAIVAIVENHAQKDGTIKIPKVLQPWMGKKEIKAN